jgi:hypothetical protein
MRDEEGTTIDQTALILHPSSAARYRFRFHTAFNASEY